MPLPVIAETARLWADVELRFTPTGKAVATVPLVFNKRVKNRDTGDWENGPSLFVRATAWDQLAEHCAESLGKGTEVVVRGELSMREYEKKDGGTGQSLELHLYGIGPSLSYATAKVNKVQRGSGSGGFGGGQSSGGGFGSSGTAPQDDPWGSPAPAGGGFGGSDDPPPF